MEHPPDDCPVRDPYGGIQSRHDTYEIRKAQVVGTFTRESMELTTEHDPAVDMLRARLSAYVLTKVRKTGEDVHTVATPASWWQHFKADCFPAWARERWPVKMHERKVVFSYTARECFPEADVACPPEFGRSTRWLEIVTFSYGPEES